MKVPLVDLAAQETEIVEEALGAIAATARQAQFVLGARVREFEAWLAATSGVAHAVGVASGTDALELGLRALGVGTGDAVVTPAFSFVAAAEAIAATGARPVFCDVDLGTLTASVATVQAALDRARAAGWRVRAIVPVHLFGLCTSAPGVAALAQRAGLALVEDAAQALGARDGDGRAAGSSGDVGCFSFFPTKSLGAWGDGGAVVTSRDDVADRVRRLRAHGATEPYVHAELGRNSRLDELHAAVLLVKTRRLAAWQAPRARLALRYVEGLSRLPLALPAVPPAPAIHAWNVFVVRTPRRDDLAVWLRAAGIEARVYYPIPLHRQPCFDFLDEPPLSGAEEACRTALALPLYPAMTDDQQSYVLEAVARFFATS